METPLTSIEDLFEPVEAYVKTTIELSKLKILDSATIVVTSILARIGVISVISMFILVLSTGIALWLGEILGKVYYGFFIIAGFYLLAGIVFHFFLRNWIKGPISEIIIKQVLK
ncbi:MAG: hypothetical protein JW731_02560 [Bacteroidales bacterium]|nr:hypothetical protein [Bacteroidales bacterium]